MNEVDWLKAARAAAAASHENRLPYLADAARLTGPAIAELRVTLGQLLTGDLSARRLDYVLENAFAEDRAQDFPRTSLPAFQKGPAQEDEVWAEFEASRSAAAILKPVDGFLALCDGLARYCSRCRDQYQQREAGLTALREELHRTGLSLEDFAKLSDDAERAARLLDASELCAQSDWAALAKAAADLTMLAKRTIPPDSWDRALGKPYETELGRALMHAFVRVGFNGKLRNYTKKDAAIYASALAARHGFALEVNSLTSYASELKP